MELYKHFTSKIYVIGKKFFFVLMSQPKYWEAASLEAPSWLGPQENFIEIRVSIFHQMGSGIRFFHKNVLWFNVKFIDFARVSLKELYVQLIYRYLIGIAIRIRIGSFQKNNDFGCSRSIFLTCLGISPFDCRRKSCTLRLLKLPLQIHIWMGTYLRGMLISLDKVRTNLQTRWINSKQDKEYNEPRDILFSEN